MKPTLMIVAAAALCGGLPAWAQTGNIAVAPPSGSTGPTVPDTRQVDQNTVVPPASSAKPTNGNPTNNHGNWRTSDGFNADPDNPSGAPGSSSISTSPTR